MVTVRWFVCPTVSMVTTGHATGLEKTLLVAGLQAEVGVGEPGRGHAGQGRAGQDFNTYLVIYRTGIDFTNKVYTFGNFHTYKSYTS